MRTLKVGTPLLVENTRADGGPTYAPTGCAVSELEWTPKGRLIVRMHTTEGHELALTRRELAMNGAI